MALGLGTLFTTGLFSKNKGKIIGVAVIAVVALVIYGGMKWDAWRIENLKEDLQKERQANVQNTETIEEQGRLVKIDEAALTQLLDSRDTLRRETDERMKQVISDVRRILENEQDRSRRDLEELGNRLEEVSDGAGSTRVVREVTAQPVGSANVSDRVVRRLADGMWDTYCDGIPDDRVCAQRQSTQNGSGDQAAQ